MKRIKFTLLMFVLAIFAGNAYSQHDDNIMKEKIEKIKAQKVAFITQKVGLSVSEAQAFWPLYNEYEKKRDEITDEQRKIFKNDKIDTYTDKEAELISDKYVDYEIQEANLLKEYYVKFKTVLPPKKVLNIYMAEKEFHRKLLKDLQEKHKN